jgi:hypothetical protein
MTLNSLGRLVYHTRIFYDCSATRPSSCKSVEIGKTRPAQSRTGSLASRRDPKVPAKYVPGFRCAQSGLQVQRLASLAATAIKLPPSISTQRTPPSGAWHGGRAGKFQPLMAPSVRRRRRHRPSAAHKYRSRARHRALSLGLSCTAR